MWEYWEVKVYETPGLYSQDGIKLVSPSTDFDGVMLFPVEDLGQGKQML